MKTLKIKIIKYFARLIPFAVWAMLVLLPIFGATLIFDSAIETEKDLLNAVMKQKLAIEIEKYNQELDLEVYIYNSLGIDYTRKYTRAIYQMENPRFMHNTNPFLKELPDSSADTSDQIFLLRNLFKKLVGSEPSFVYLLEEDPQLSGWFHNSPLKMKCSQEKFRKDLSTAYKYLAQRIEIEQKNQSLNIERASEKFLIPPKIENTPEIIATIGLTEPLSSSLNWSSSRYSINLHSLLVTNAFPILRRDNRLSFVLFGSSIASIDPFFMLEKISQRLSNEQFQHEMFFPDQPILMPSFIENDERLFIQSRLPEAFNFFETEMNLRHIRVPALRISCKSPEYNAKRQRKATGFLLKLYTMLVSFFMLGLYFGKFRVSNSMFRVVSVGFFAGILLPLSGSIWLGQAYLNTRKHLEAEVLLDYMKNRILQKEQTIELQKARNVLFQNIFSSMVAKFSISDLENLYLKTGFYNPDKNNSRYRPGNESLMRRFYAITFIKPGYDDFIATSNHKHKTTDTIHPFFSGRSKEVLFKLGAYKGIPERKIKAIMDTSQLAMGLIDQSIDKRLYIRTFSENQTPIINTLTTGLNFLTGIFLRNSQNEICGLSLIQFERRAWNHDLDELIEENRIQNVFAYKGYNIFVNFFELNAFSDRKLRRPDLSLKKLATDNLINLSLENSNISMPFLWDTAQALYSFTSNIRINNLSSADPHLINAAAICDNQYFAIAYAIPASANNGFDKTNILFLLVALAIFSSMVLAWGIAWVLTRALQSFQSAIENLNDQDYSWELNLKTGDEFDLLAESFNHMTQKLHENKKISRLVSRNVLDAIESEDENLMKPGGSRVKASLLFCDIRSFTSITEANPPEAVVEMLNEYFTCMSNCIESHGGIIDKLIGDAIQAVFYAHENESCALNAVKAAVAMRCALQKMNDSRKSRNLFSVENGIGICTGSIVCGRIGSESGKLDATVIGSLVNKSAALESLSKHGTATRIIMDQATAEETSSATVTQTLEIAPDTRILELVKIRST